MTTESRRVQDSDLKGRLVAAWLTQGLAHATLERLARLAELSRVPAGEVLTREGEPTPVLAIVLEGRVGLRMRVPERGAVTILTVEPGDVVGWSAVVPPHRATSTAVTLVPSELAVFNGAELRHQLDNDPELAAHFYLVLLGAMARRLEGTRLQLLDLFTQRWVEPW